MDNSFFLLSKQELDISRFHICTWDIKDNNAFIEFGIEIKKGINTHIDLQLIIPFLDKECTFKCLSQNLIVDSSNCKFIFNDTIESCSPINGDNRLGANVKFKSRDEVTVLPVSKPDIKHNEKMILFSVDIPRTSFETLYLRFYIKTKQDTLSTDKRGIAKKTFTYDIRLNEKRSLPDDVLEQLNKGYMFCNIQKCFCFHIVPSAYDINFVDSSKLKNIRELESVAFAKYINDAEKDEKNKIKIKDKSHTIVFSKVENADSYSFFTIFNKERIGTKQIIMALVINLICSLLFAFAPLRKEINAEVKIWKQIPLEYWIAFILIITIITWLSIKSINHKN